MSVKNTKRKGFNFFRSYFDVYNELEQDEDKLAFIDALLNKQFLGQEPEELKGMAKFAWISQQHSISEQVKGFETKTGIKLTPTQGGYNTPTEQVEVQVEVQEQDSVSVFTPTQFLSWFNESRTKLLDKPSNINYLSQESKSYLEILTTRYTGNDFNKALHNICNDKWANETNNIMPKHFLKPDEFSKYLDMDVKPLISKKQKLMKGWAVK